MSHIENCYYVGGMVVRLKGKGVHTHMEAAQNEIVHYTDNLKGLNRILNVVVDGGGN